VADAAGRVADAAGLARSPLTSARDVPDALEVTKVAEDDLTQAATTAAGEASRAVHDESGAGRVAVIAVPERVAGLRAAGREAGLPLPPEGVLDLDAPVVVLTPREAKGLEFDVVVLVEPSEVLAQSAGDLYVAMTRPTRALRVLHARDLPAGF